MAPRSNSRGRAPTVSDFNDTYRKLLAAVDAALDGDTDPETGARIKPTAAVLNVARQVISDAGIQPSQDVEADAGRISQRLPFNSPDPETF